MELGWAEFEYFSLIFLTGVSADVYTFKRSRGVAGGGICWQMEQNPAQP